VTKRNANTVCTQGNPWCKRTSGGEDDPASQITPELIRRLGEYGVTCPGGSMREHPPCGLIRELADRLIGAAFERSIASGLLHVSPTEVAFQHAEILNGADPRDYLGPSGPAATDEPV